MTQDIGILSFGAYLPRLRLQRKAIAAANTWFAPGLRGQAKGERAIAQLGRGRDHDGGGSGARLPGRASTAAALGAAGAGLDHAPLRRPAERRRRGQRAEPALVARARRTPAAACVPAASALAAALAGARPTARRWWSARTHRQTKAASSAGDALRRRRGGGAGRPAASRSPGCSARTARRWTSSHQFRMQRPRARLRLGGALDPRRGLPEDRADARSARCSRRPAWTPASDHALLHAVHAGARRPRRGQALRHRRRARCATTWPRSAATPARRTRC